MKVIKNAEGKIFVLCSTCGSGLLVEKGDKVEIVTSMNYLITCPECKNRINIFHIVRNLNLPENFFGK